MYREAKLVVRAIIENKNNEFLFQQRNNYEFCLFGGKVDPGESIEQALKREIKEETNLTIAKSEFILFHDCLTNKLNTNLLSFYYKINYEGIIRLNEESTDKKWIHKNYLQNYNILYGNDEAILQYLHLREKHPSKPT